jgi:hypothetical protein
MTQRIKNKQISITSPFDINGQIIYNVAYPTGSTDATNKSYVDSKTENLNYSSDVNMVANSGISGTYLACNTGITAIPATRVRVFLNSIEINVGNGTTSADCYFSSDSGVTAKVWDNITLGDYLYWNGGYAPFQLEATDGFTFEYLIL